LEIIDKILVLPAIVQGALGSLLFYVCFELIKRAVNLFTQIVGNGNSRWKEETLLLELAHAQMDAVPSGTDENKLLLLCIFTALNRMIMGLIYVCFGLVVHLPILDGIGASCKTPGGTEVG
jgi:hypothetical protein